MNNYKYISNKPCGEDLFKSRVHTKISENLTKTIKKENIKIIGLEGRLGSGKSNIISLVKNKLEDTHFIFTFDAWSYQEDLKRRVFLEELTEKLIKLELLKGGQKWKKELKDLLARKQEETTKTIPQFSNGIVLMTLLIIINSFTNNVSNEALKSITPNFLIEFFLNSNLLLKGLLIGILKNIVILIPTIFYILRFSHKKSFKFFKKVFWLDLFFEIRELFYIYKEKELDKTISTVTSTKEPSVREFNQWMKNLELDLENRKLVIVFDNMDRVSKDKVKSLWTMIHTFFSESEEKNIENKNITVIVPFDRGQLNKLFSENEEQKEGDLLISKTFAKIYTIPALVMTDWEDFFKEKLMKALPEIPHDKYILVKNLYDLKTEKMVPREIINFINGLVSLKEYWNDEISVEYLAIYELEKEKLLEEPISQILNKDYLKNAEHIFHDSRELEKNMAALVHGVSPEEATQVLLQRELIKSLNNKNIKNLEGLEKHSEFYNILSKFIHEITNLKNTIESLEKLENKGSDEANFKIIWRVLTNKFLNGKQENFKFEKHHEVILMNTKNKEEILSHLVNKNTDLSKVKGQVYAEEILRIKDFVEEKMDINFISVLQGIAFEEKEFLEAIKIFGSEYKEYKIITDDLDSYLVKNIDTILDENIEYNLLKSLKEEPLKEFKEELKTKINKFENIKNIEKTYKGYFSLFDKPLTNLRDNYMRDDALYNLLIDNSSNQEGKYILSALLLKDYKLNKVITQVGYRNHCLTQINNLISEDIKNIAKYIEYFMTFDEVLEESISTNNTDFKNIMIQISKYLIENKTPFGSRANVKTLLKKYDSMKKELKIESDKIIECFDGWSKYVEENINTENIKEVFKTNEFILDSLDVKCDLSSKIQNIYKEKIKSTSKEEFVEELKTNKTYYIKMIKELNESEGFKVPQNLKLGYKVILENLAKKDTLLKDIDEEILNFLKNKITTGLIMTFKNIRDIFINNTDIDIELFLFLGEELIKFGSLDEKSDDSLRRIFLRIIEDVTCRKIILENSDIVIKIVEKSTDSVENFKEKLKEILEKDHDDSELLKFMSNLGIEVIEEGKVEEEK